MPMLSKLLAELLLEHRGNDVDCTCVECLRDSRQVSENAIFFAIPGTRDDGAKFISDAVARGAGSIVCAAGTMTEIPDAVNLFKVSDVRHAYSLACRAKCGNPDRELDIFGVTGTNGKTTSVYLLRHLLNGVSHKCAMISTVEFDDSSKTVPATHTTPDPELLFPLLRNAADHGAKAAAMEFSSHALEQKRLAGLQVKTALLTNITGDHLDYHQDMQNYFQAKKLLFTRTLANGGCAVINIDDPLAAKLAKELGSEKPELKIATFGANTKADFQIISPASDAEKCTFKLHCEKLDFPVSFPLPGAYNIHNLAGVLAALLVYGIAPAALQEALKHPLRVPGRLEPVKAPSGAIFYVDFAHTHDALQNVLITLRKCCKGRLIALFGCGGDRDKSKRPQMGKAASQYADITIITSDNPRSENPETIIAEISSGINSGSLCFCEPDRRKALAFAAARAGKDDIVLVAGKGHENYQEINGIKHHFNDIEELQNIFKGENNYA